MTQDFRDLVNPSCELLAYGEPTHLAPAFGLVRNELFARLVDLGFRSIALETDRVAALAVNDYVRDGVGTFAAAMNGFTHTLGELDHNRQLIAWMREYNTRRPARERLSFHGFDMATEMMNAPSPRQYLERARDYLGVDHDVAALAGDDERWSRTEAILDPAMSVGATAEADALRATADDMLIELYARAPAAKSRAEWLSARTHLTGGLDLLRYHKQSAQRVDETTRISRMCAIRDAAMARNLLDVRDIEAGPTLVFAQNRHLQRNLSTWRLGTMDIEWHSAGAIVGSLLGERYVFIAGSLGRCRSIDLADPAPNTYEGHLQTRTNGWAATSPSTIPPSTTRTDPTPMQGYFPLDSPTLNGADLVLHITDGDAEPAPTP
jgi:erythromycin esterase-like protein